MYGDSENNEKNTIVAYADPNFQLKSGDYVQIDGKIVDRYEGENSFGSTLSALQIVSAKIKISSYMEAMAPTISTLTPKNLVNSQHIVDVRVTKVEFAKKEAFVYYTVTNNFGSTNSFYDFNMKATQNGKKFEVDGHYEADYPSVSGDVLNGITMIGIAAYKGLDPTNFDLYFNEYSSDNYDQDFTEFTMNIIVK